jgi:hypothetical protein
MVGDVAGDQQQVGRERHRAHMREHALGPDNRLGTPADVEVADVGDGEHVAR